ncbi:DUF559 domain-containing protein [Pseudomonas sp. LS44]|uniref:endonuclease domain-containing protein n=1 Tax=Pseudomonas sp. LS44 TaxID=1357074 RepID=UPI00215AA384|nr:DUF559 domain-containing protein [Pseudomonas sp. LS44]UVE17220.1 DUF559 domain-containing protein [Pseudomonas sp. LS44]
MTLRDNAKRLRSEMTEAEMRLWYYLRGHRFLGLKFKRQKPLGPYIVDFVCLECRLIIELDGSKHQQQVEQDRVRDRHFQQRGFRVLRFWNHEMLAETEAVLEAIRLAVDPLPSPLP